jgi:hypothetical protein
VVERIFKIGGFTHEKKAMEEDERCHLISRPDRAGTERVQRQ